MDNNLKFGWLDMAKRLQAVAQAGLEYSDNKYDIDRYEQIRGLSLEILNNFTDLTMNISNSFTDYCIRFHPEAKVKSPGCCKKFYS